MRLFNIKDTHNLLCWEPMTVKLNFCLFKWKLNRTPLIGGASCQCWCFLSVLVCSGWHHFWLSQIFMAGSDCPRVSLHVSVSWQREPSSVVLRFKGLFWREFFEGLTMSYGVQIVKAFVGTLWFVILDCINKIAFELGRKLNFNFPKVCFRSGPNTGLV